MLELAKQTLGDLIKAVDMLNVVEDEQMLRILLFSAVGLNRSVGCALQNDENPDVRLASDRLYSEWKADDECIFNTFIKPYRDFVLHEAGMNLENGLPLAVVDFEQNVVLDWCYDETLYLTITPYEDDKRKVHDHGDLDVRDLLEESIEWWKVQLARIEEMVRSGEG